MFFVEIKMNLHNPTFFFKKCNFFGPFWGRGDFGSLVVVGFIPDQCLGQAVPPRKCGWVGPTFRGSRLILWWSVLVLNVFDPQAFTDSPSPTLLYVASERYAYRGQPLALDLEDVTPPPPPSLRMFLNRDFDFPFTLRRAFFAPRWEGVTGPEKC